MINYKLLDFHDASAIWDRSSFAIAYLRLKMRVSSIRAR